MQVQLGNVADHNSTFPKQMLSQRLDTFLWVVVAQRIPEQSRTCRYSSKRPSSMQTTKVEGDIACCKVLVEVDRVGTTT
jgi:hypothetical protein